MSNKNSRSKSSARWLDEHVGDPWVKKAKKEGYRARAAYKLLEIERRDRILWGASLVVDLGSSPGSWSQAVARIAGGRTAIVAMDILPMEPVEGVTFILGDFRARETLDALNEVLADRPVDVVLSDMAPNISGCQVRDQAGSYHLCDLALEFCREHLKSGGDFLVKVFQGEGFDEFRRDMADCFDSVKTRKPKASRDRSSELYLLGRGFRRD